MGDLCIYHWSVQLKPNRKVVINDCFQIVVVDRTPLINGKVTDLIRVFDFVDDPNREQLIEMLTVSPIDGPLLAPGSKPEPKEVKEIVFSSK